MQDEQKVARDLRKMAMEQEGKVQRYHPRDDFKVQVMYCDKEFHLWVVTRGRWPHRGEIQAWRHAFNVPLKACMTGPVNLGPWKGQTYEWNPRSEVQVQGQLRMAA